MKDNESTDERFMRLALRVARRDWARPLSTPMAGAVAVIDDRVVGRGYGAGAQSRSAVITALERAGADAASAAVYTNIEPCLNPDEVQPFVSKLRDITPRRIVVGTEIAGSVIESLREAGIRVDSGVLGAECRQANAAYFKHRETGLPFVTVKFAASLDGRIATELGHSKWISSKQTLRFAHQLRRDHQAILVGIGTVLTDDPALTVRLVKGRNPIRVIVDSRLRIPPTAQVLSDGAAARTIIATTEFAEEGRVRDIERFGAQVIRLRALSPPAIHSQPDNILTAVEGSPFLGVNLVELLAELGRRDIASVLVEGGSRIITSLLAGRLVDRFIAVIAPKIIGKGKEAIGDLGISQLTDAITFSSVKVRKLGPDVVFDGRITAQCD